MDNHSQKQFLNKQEKHKKETNKNKKQQTNLNK
jgi:hypothetical protein